MITYCRWVHWASTRVTSPVGGTIIIIIIIIIVIIMIIIMITYCRWGRQED